MNGKETSLSDIIVTSISEPTTGTNSQTEISFQNAGGRSVRTSREKGIICVAVILFLAVVGLGIALGIILSQPEGELSKPEVKLQDPDVCLTEGCALAAAQVISGMDTSVDPCEDFYKYSCGGWMRKNIIPEDRSSLSRFGVLGDAVDVTLKYLLEQGPTNDIDATIKAKHMYQSCINESVIEDRGFEIAIPLLDELGGWPMLGSNPGGNWNESAFDLIKLLVSLRKYNNAPLIHMYVGSDVKNSNTRIINLDQPGFGLPGRNYYLQQRYAQMREAYKTLIKNVAMAFGANAAVAENDTEDILQFETDLANISMAAEDRRDGEALYNMMTIDQLGINFTEPGSTDIIQFNWLNYFNSIMTLPNVSIPVNGSEPVVVEAVPFFEKLFAVLQNYPKRVIANYLVWRIMKNRAANLPQVFRDHLQEYRKTLYGTVSSRARWRDCVGYVNNLHGLASGRLFVMTAFDEVAKSNALEMIENIRDAFYEILDELDWMDSETRDVAREKAEAIKEWIGYPSDILNNTWLNDYYKHVTVYPDTYFENVLSHLKRGAIEGLANLREPYDKNRWTTPPAYVNAYYSSIRNTIMFPAGILQPPFYGDKQPRSMNYGGIGAVIGHEITHGFDDRGRQYDKDGNLQQWWSDDAITRFKNRTQCIIDQYSNFVVPEAGLNLNGINTQGENIADNGGLKQSYRAYRSWIEKRGKEEPRLPGVNFTNDQLFFINFAQIWCVNMRRESAINRVETGVHSPGQFRVTGTLQNSDDFARTFNCPYSKYMNPRNKCYVW